MGWVLLEIIVPLGLAILVGLLIGWLLWRWRRTEVEWSEYERWQTTSAKHQTLDGEVNHLVGERDAALTRLADQDAELDDLRGKVSAFVPAPAHAATTNEPDPEQITLLRNRLSDAEAETLELRRSLAAAAAATAVLESRLAAVDARDAELEAQATAGADGAADLVATNALVADSRSTVRSDIDLVAARASGDDAAVDLRGDTDDGTAAVDLRGDPGDDTPGATGPGDRGNVATVGKAARSDGRSTLVGAGVLPALADGATRYPYGEGSHGPLADKTQPDGHPIKGNVDSMLYHRPDSRNYRATVAEVWFDNPHTARTAGFTKARTHPDLSTADEAIADHLSDPTIASKATVTLPALADGATRYPYGEGSHGPLADKTQPDGHPIKGNVDSMLYHRPDSRNYRATVAEVWFDNPHTARTAGFTKARTHPDLSTADEAIADHLSDPTIASKTTVTLPALADGATRYPYGEGSHGPLADKTQPDGHPIKGNVDSMLYHRPDSRNYRATVAEVWFETSEAAEGAGFAKAPTHPNSK